MPDQIVVTEEMKSVGGDMLTGWESMNPGMTDDEDMAEAVFLAMWQIYLDRGAS